ncbi:hypothetical protein LSTR_LSTR004185 [Laodelphax striatellus]|uniref:Cathepsin L1-like n=1 Tax=Laodelphax striatellus TaxID=195883 RepID=A0A482X9J4_LAOST|nr:hypothetical protein LSTR_LSTR004185 [Laodelphax striatellus]
MRIISGYFSALMMFNSVSLQIIPPGIEQKVVDRIKSTGIDVSDIQNRVHDFAEEWHRFKANFNKSYSILGESARKMTWQDNFLRVIKHNEEAKQGLHSYTLKVNHLADMTLKDYLQSLIRLLKSMRRKGEEDLLGVPFHNASEIPEELDWRERGFKGKVWNQLDCGSCYAFTVVSIVEGQIFKKTGELKYLSTQQVLDCSKSTGNMGCRGGSLRNTLRYVQENGLIDQSIYPYSAKETTCHYQKAVALYKIKSWNILPSKDEEALKIALATVGPIAVSINASPSTFQLYHDGLYDDASCTSDKLNHAMLLVGYTKDAWILKNWWSDQWGKEGYMLLRRHRNQCGVANFAAYAEV